VKPNNDHSIVLSGGGARGAYQAGALRALYEVCKEANNFAPFRNIVGVSAGAINAAYIASEVDNIDRATERLCTMWRRLTTPDVLKTDTVTIGMTALRVMRAISLGGFSDRLRPPSLGLLNVEPLRDLLVENIQFSNISEHIRAGRLNALAISATDYSTAINVSFYMGADHIKDWRRVSRMGIRQDIGIDHVMASAAIPLFFPPWPIGKRFYGDGCLRNTAPLSPSRRIGTTKVIVIGVRNIKDEVLDDAHIIKPTLGRILSVVINALFMDAIEVDIERVGIINESLRQTSTGQTFKPIEIHYTRPSQAPSELAEARVEGLPSVLRFLLTGLGTPKESAEILSYLTFDPIYLNSLVDLGYNDLLSRRSQLLTFLTK